MKRYQQIIVLSLFCVFFHGCDQAAKNLPVKKVRRPVKVMTLHTRGDADKANTFSGIAKGVNESVLSFRVPGVLQTLSANVGDKVVQGQVVATLDDRDYRLRVEDVKHKLKSAEAQLEQLQKGVRSEDLRIIDQKINALNSSVKTAETEYRRVQKLYAADAASKSQLDTVKTQLDQLHAELKSVHEERAKAVKGGRDEEVRSAQASLRSIRSNLAQVQASLEDTQLTIPFDGFISVKHVANFQQVGAGYPIYTLVDIDHIEIQVSVPDRLIAGIVSQQDVLIEFLNFPGRKFRGKTSKVGVAADKRTLTYPVFVEVENPDRVILPGMSATVFIKPKTEARPYPLIPVHAVLEDKISHVRFVWLYTPKTESIEKRVITLGRIVEDKIEALNGLSDGEKVVIAGVHRIKEGMQVRLP